MRLIEGLEDGRRGRAERNAQIRSEAQEKYGPGLGNAYSDYVIRTDIFDNNRELNRKAFAEAVVESLGDGATLEEKVLGITALLTAVEALIAPVAQTAAAANSHDVRY